MVREIIIAVALGILNTAFVSLSILGNTGGTNFGTALATLVFWILSLVPLFVSGLGYGVKSAAISVGTSAVIAALAIGVPFALTYLGVAGLPVILLVRQALLWRQGNGVTYWYPADRLLLWWAGICIILTGLAMALLGWDDAMRQGLIDGFDQMMAQVAEMQDAAPRMTGEAFVALIPQYMGPMWGLFILLSGCLAQGVLVRFKKNIRPTPELSKMVLPQWLAIAFIGATVASVLLDGTFPLLGAVEITLVALFFLQGMAVIHVVSHRWNARAAILGVIYVVTIMMLWMVLLIAILGLMETWVGFRRRFAPPPRQEED